MEQLDSSQRRTQLIASQEVNRAKRMAFLIVAARWFGLDEVVLVILGLRVHAAS